MRALVKTERGVALEKRERPKLNAPDCVEIAVHRAAICRTDLYAAEGRITVERGRVLGHEFAGVVEAVGSDVSQARPGDPVTRQAAANDCSATEDMTSRFQMSVAPSGSLVIHRLFTFGGIP